MHPVSILHDARIQWLAAALRGERPAWSADLGDTEGMLATACAEGVAPLVSHESNARHGEWLLPAEFEQGLAAATRAEAVSCLVREAECRRILDCLAETNLPALLLKGSALAYWAYDAPYLRPCVDIDFLFASHAAAATAARALARLGYAPLSRALPGDLTTFELGCVRVVGGTHVWADLHWGVGGAPLFANRLGIEELFAASIALPKLATTARAIGPVHAYLHNSTHRALQLHLGSGDRLKWHYDLHLLAQNFSAADWNQLATLCEERGLAGTCQDAMESSAALFATQLPQSVVDRLTRARRTEKLDVRRMYSWKYMEYQNFRALPTLRQRLRWLRQRLVPNRVYLDDMYGGRWAGYGRYLHKGLRKFLGGTS
ncbi:MAG TPA: nucleotidyltransferase family protein [Rudaea sp.]|jgi:hypothetical protein|uniref:nucleotidyltransferase family protein n=1 Tax=Rudaea sp. TaxID=2136325 RepID=UPI002F95195E